MKTRIILGMAAICLSSAAIAQTAATQPDPNAGVPTGAAPPATGMVPADPNVARDPAAPVGSAENPVVIGGNMTPPPPPKDHYPVCKGAVQDECMNAQAAHGHPL